MKPKSRHDWGKGPPLAVWLVTGVVGGAIVGAGLRQLTTLGVGIVLAIAAITAGIVAGLTVTLRWVVTHIADWLGRK